MAHLINEYSRHCGAKPAKPIIGEHFFPVVGFCRYITIDTSASSQASQYPYWREVVKLLRKTMEPDIKIVRIANPKESRSIGEDLALGSLSIKQVNYVIVNSLAHICVNGFSHHLASAKGIPLVVLYSNNSPEYCGPIWSDNHINIKPKYKNKKPSFSAEEKNPVIFSIFPDRIVECLSKLVDFVSPPKEKVNYIGPAYHHELLEVVPDFYHPIKELAGRLLNVRLDKAHNEDILCQWLQSNKCSIISNKPISLDIIAKFRRNIPYVNFFCNLGEFPSEEYLQKLGALGVPFKLYSSEADSEELRKEMNRYFDFSFDRIIRPTKWPKELKNATHFKSNKRIFCKNGIFLSRAHLDAMDRGNNIIKSLDFLEELDHFYLYEQK